mmetsp:Transcript_15036/g.29558  ORF Transcript_15036/g.29558 Transcript_15036/m.29558 type:complete len:282 (-) Transcript_15036:274-1119(-)
MAEEKQPINLPSPLIYLDQLAANEAGNTPRPSEVLTLFLQGMRTVENDPTAGKKFLTEACKKASEATKGPKSTKLDVERFACAEMGLGYSYALLQEAGKCAQHYQKSLQLWMKVHNGLSPKMVDFLLDVSAALMAAQKWDDALNILKGQANLVLKDKSKGSKSPEMAQTLCRMAVVLGELGMAGEAVKYFEKARAGVSIKDTDPYRNALLNTCHAFRTFLDKYQAAAAGSQPAEETKTAEPGSGTDLTPERVDSLMSDLAKQIADLDMGVQKEPEEEEEPV